MRLALNIFLSVLAIVLIAAVAIFFLKPGLDGPGARLDLNSDGLLTEDELPPLVRRQFAAIDSSGDGVIGPVELRVYYLTQYFHGGDIHEPPVYEGNYRYLDLGRHLAASIEAGEMWGAVLMIGFEGKTQFAMSFGNLETTTQVPLASATKWLTAAVMIALADRGDIDLFAPIGEWAAGIPDTHSGMTIPQMMAHVSGMDSRVGVVSAPTMEAAAKQVLGYPVVAAPGEQFRYGASSMTLAAWIAEAQTGREWRPLADEVLFEPLGMSNTVYANPMRPIEAGLKMAPEVASGAFSTAEDYMKFLAMIAGRGRLPDGKTVLGASRLTTMRRAQSMGAERAFVPPAVNHPFEYAMGAWCERWTDPGLCTLLHSQGAFGTRPFVDIETGIYGILLMVEAGNQQRDIIQQIREVALATAKNELGFNHEE